MSKTPRVCELGEVASITSGFAFKSKLFGSSGPIPLIRNRDVRRGYSETFYSGPYSRDFIVSDGDLLVSMDGDFRVAVWRGGRALLNQRVCRIDVDSRHLDARFLTYLLPAELRRIQRATSYATVRHLSAKTLRAIPIALPFLPEQRRIAAILDEADAIRRKRRESLGLLDELLRSAFLEMFGDPVRNQHGREASLLDQVADVVSGVTKGRKFRGGIEPEPVPYLRVANVQDGFLSLEDLRTIPATPSEIERFRLLPGDVLLTEGGDPDKLGRGSVWRGAADPCIHQNHIFRVRVHDRAVLPDYLSALIGSAYGKRYFLRAAKQTTGIASINRTQLGRFPVLLAPIEIQVKYQALVSRLGLFRQTSRVAAQQADDLFSSLSQRAFQGEL